MFGYFDSISIEEIHFLKILKQESTSSVNNLLLSLKYSVNLTWIKKPCLGVAYMNEKTKE